MKKILYFFILCCSSVIAQKNSVVTNSVTCIPVASVCNPATQDSATAAGLGIGISFVGLHQIHKTSAGQSETLQEFTCTDSTSLNIAQAYAFEVHTGLTFEESVTAWIDFSNDGAFVNQEIVFHDSAEVFMHTGFITIPTSVLNTFTPIRMRVGSEYSGNPGLNGCADPLYGQYEDYKIYYGVNIGIAENEKTFASSVFPNPLQTSAVIDLGGNNTFRNTKLLLRVYNCFGNLVSQKEMPAEAEVTIDGTMLSNGLYFYELSNSRAEKSTGKFVVE